MAEPVMTMAELNPVELELGVVNRSDQRDYDLVRRAIAYLSETRDAQPNLAALASHLGLSPTHCQKLFTRWCGLSPKDFVAALTLDHARNMLRESDSVLEAAHSSGLSGGGRLHDLFVRCEAMTPGEFKRAGADIAMAFGVHETPFGTAVAVATARGLAALAFVNEDAQQTEADVLAEFQARWPNAGFVERPEITRGFVERIFSPAEWDEGRPVQLVLIGTDFEVRVWRALLKIPMGQSVSYGDVARHVCSAKAARAVGTAVGRNPLSFVVPCHRVRRSDGGLGGYHWGLTRKQAIVGWEAGQLARCDKA